MVNNNKNVQVFFRNQASLVINLGSNFCEILQKFIVQYIYRNKTNVGKQKCHTTVKLCTLRRNKSAPPFCNQVLFSSTPEIPDFLAFMKNSL